MPSTQDVCGDFEVPVNPDLGQCTPLRVVVPCDRPTLPASPCNEEDIEIRYNPDESPAFTILGGILSADCLNILDQNSVNVLAIY